MSLRWVKSHVPKGGWEYEEPTTGKVFHGLVRSTVVGQITKHRMEKGIPVGDVDRDLDAAVCRKLPGECKEETELRHKVKSKFGVDDVRSFLNSVAHVFKNGGVVSQSIANERARICSECPMNTTVSGCSGCNGVSQLVFDVIGAKKTNYDNVLQNCGVCGCSLKAKVWITEANLKEIQSVKNATDNYPSNCWMHKNEND